MTITNHGNSFNLPIGTPVLTLQTAFRKLLPVASSWMNVGTLLGIDKSILDNIKSNERQVEDCLREMLSAWLNQVTPKPTWVNLADAVEPFNERTAHHIRGLGQ